MKTSRHPAFIRWFAAAVLAFGLAADAAAWQLFVRTPTGKTVTLEVDSSAVCIVAAFVLTSPRFRA